MQNKNKRTLNRKSTKMTGCVKYVWKNRGTYVWYHVDMLYVEHVFPVSLCIEVVNAPFVIRVLIREFKCMECKEKCIEMNEILVFSPFIDYFLRGGVHSYRLLKPL